MRLLGDSASRCRLAYLEAGSVQMKYLAGGCAYREIEGLYYF